MNRTNSDKDGVTLWKSWCSDCDRYNWRWSVSFGEDIGIPRVQSKKFGSRTKAMASIEAFRKRAKQAVNPVTRQSMV